MIFDEQIVPIYTHCSRQGLCNLARDLMFRAKPNRLDNHSRMNFSALRLVVRGAEGQHRSVATGNTMMLPMKAEERQVASHCIFAQRYRYFLLIHGALTPRAQTSACVYASAVSDSEICSCAESSDARSHSPDSWASMSWYKGRKRLAPPSKTALLS